MRYVSRIANLEPTAPGSYRLGAFFVWDFSFTFASAAHMFYHWEYRESRKA